MARILTLLLLIFFGSFLFATSSSLEPVNEITDSQESVESWRESLIDINRHWSHRCLDWTFLDKASPILSRTELIAVHLQLVELSLRYNWEESLSSSQMQAREKALDDLTEYYQTGQFPKNTSHANARPYFIDQTNTACAVGHLMQTSGAEALAETIKLTNNNGYIEELLSPELSSWASNSGFSVSELQWIQPTYAPPFFVIPNIMAPSCLMANGTIELDIVPGSDPTMTVNLDDNEVNWYAGYNTSGTIISEDFLLTDIPAGVYTALIVNSSNSLINVAMTIFLSNNGELAIDAVVVPEGCGDMSGSVTATASGGTGDYTYLWTRSDGLPFGFGPSITNLDGYDGTIFPFPASFYTYHLAVTDQAGCVRYESYQIFETLSATVSPDETELNSPECYTDSGGSITVVAVGEEPLTFEWSNGDTGSTITDLSAGTYEVTITDALGCSSKSSFELLPPECPAPVCDVSFDYEVENCIGTDDAPQTYAEDLVNFTNNSDFIGIASDWEWTILGTSYFSEELIAIAIPTLIDAVFQPLSVEVCLSYKTSFGCQNTACKNIELTGLCNPDPCNCSNEIIPVCGDDGFTYQNACQADCALVNYEEGECCICEDIDAPVCSADGLTTYQNACEAECAGETLTSEGECCICDNIDAPVCSADGLTTYQNACEAECAGETLTSEGECCICDDIDAPVCSADGLTTYQNACEAECAGETITSEGECCICEDINAPVCSADGLTTYQNACEAECAGETLTSEGECCICDDIDAPVCSADGLTTYQNACEAECAGETLTSEGECCICDDIDAPVCSADGLTTYQNACEAECAGETITSEGECCICPFEYAPVCGSDGMTYSNSCEAECAGVGYSTGECCNCPDVYAPVCGSDGMTYTNICEAQCANVTYENGACDDCECPAVVQPVCGSDGVTYQNACYAVCYGVNFTAEECEGCNCPTEYDPVCGNDGNSYNNACEAECAGVGYSTGICCNCTNDIAPVCGEDGNTYLNACEAGCAGVDFEVGECCNCPAVYDPVCASNGEQYNNACLAACDGLSYTSGECDACSSCTAIYEPVCGVDGNSYDNACWATCAGVFYEEGPCATCDCPDIYDPVCGEDGNEYDNACYATCENISFTEGPCSTCDCPDVYDPVCASDGNQYNNGCLAACEGLTYIPGNCASCDCPDTIEPVCGSNGVSYANACIAACEGVDDYTVGECCFCPDFYQPVCGVDGNSYDNYCYADCAGVTYMAGDCDPCNCGDNYSPVCGLDGNTYNNPCEAICAGVFYEEGPCGDCSCPSTYAPVCGSDGMSYDNSCIAECSGVSTSYPGICSPCGCAQIDNPVCGADGIQYANACEAACAGVVYTEGVCDFGAEITCLTNIELAEIGWLSALIDYLEENGDCSCHPQLDYICTADESYVLLQSSNSSCEEFQLLSIEGDMICESDICPELGAIMSSPEQQVSLWSCYESCPVDEFGTVIQDINSGTFFIQTPFGQYYATDHIESGLTDLTSGMTVVFSHDELFPEGSTGSSDYINCLREANCVEPSIGAYYQSLGCNDEISQVCGCDGNTYNNSCEANAAGLVYWDTESCCLDLNCDDGDPCTYDHCDGFGNCVYEPIEGCGECLDPVPCAAIYECTGPITPIVICPQDCFTDLNLYIEQVESTFYCSIVNNGNCITYTPLPGMESIGTEELVLDLITDSGACFTQHIYMTIGDCNTPPVATSEQADIDCEGITINVLENDSDPDGGEVTICNVGTAENGILNVTGGIFSYEANEGFSGIEVISYSVCDESGASASAELVLQVNCEEQCENDSLFYCVQPVQPLVICPTFCDFPNGDFNVEVHSLFECSIVPLDDNCIRYTALPGYNGTEELTITACNEVGECSFVTAFVEVGDCTINMPPIATDDDSSGNCSVYVISVLLNDSDPDGDELSICGIGTPEVGEAELDGTDIIYTPQSGYTGMVLLSYTICDEEDNSSSAMISIDVDCPEVVGKLDQATQMESPTRPTVNSDLEINPAIISPTVFSPNQDGINDHYLLPDLTNEYPEAQSKMTIYNAVGQLVTIIYDLQVGWDGTNQNGEELPTGTYFYHLEINENHTQRTRTGYIHLQR